MHQRSREASIKSSAMENGHFALEMLKGAVNNDSLLPQTCSINLNSLLYTKYIRLESPSSCFAAIMFSFFRAFIVPCVDVSHHITACRTSPRLFSYEPTAQASVGDDVFIRISSNNKMRVSKSENFIAGSPASTQTSRLKAGHKINLTCKN
jgi:hypothetical protein